VFKINIVICKVCLVLPGIWKDFLTIAKEEAGSRVVETWLKAVSLYRWDPETETIYIEAPNAFVKEWIQSRYKDLFQVHLGRLLHVSGLKLIFFAGSEQKIAESTHIIPARKPIAAPGIKNALARRAHNPSTGYLNPLYCFDNFVVGSNNSLSYAAALAVAQDPGKLYNPLFIYGGSGLGKTHLMHAIGNEIYKKNNNAQILYQTTDCFVNEFINAIRFNKMHAFQQRYRALDLLLLDDVQFISNKEQTQEVFFHIFNVLHDAQKQIVFTSDLFPRQIQGLAERLRSRLEWGLVTDIQKPQLETKIAILKKKSAFHGEIIDDEIAEYIARHVDSNVRELEGSLVRIFAFSSLTRQALTLDLAKTVLGNTSPVYKNNDKIDFGKITSHVCKLYSYSLAELRSSNRAKELSFARQIAMYLMKKMTDRSLREIGAFLRRKDHSTVIHAYERVAKIVQHDAELRSTIKALEEEILGQP